MHEQSDDLGVFTTLMINHEGHSAPCTYVPGSGVLPPCPCFPYDLTTEQAVDNCQFSGVRRCNRTQAHLEQAWCDGGQDLILAIRLHLV